MTFRDPWSRKAPQPFCNTRHPPVAVTGGAFVVLDSPAGAGIRRETRPNLTKDMFAVLRVLRQRLQQPRMDGARDHVLAQPQDAGSSDRQLQQDVRAERAFDVDPHAAYE
jgi:hypothetical protein